MRIIDADELCEIIDGPTLQTKQLWTKHSSTLYKVVFEADDKIWAVEYWSDYNWGLQDDNFEVHEVEAFEVTTTEYRIKEAS